jgi:tight adherence protein B
MAAGALLGGPRAALLFAAAGAWLGPRLVAARRARRVRQIEEGAGAAASALAGALAGSASARSAIAIAAAELRGEIGRELARTAMELEMGAGTDAALDRLRARCSSRSVTLIVAAMQVQRRTGGDLARSLRDIAASIEQERRVSEEAQAATSQARFTAVVVIALPLCGLLFGELAAPGLIGRIAASGPALAMFTAAVALQALGALGIRRLARPWP